MQALKYKQEAKYKRIASVFKKTNFIQNTT